MFNLYDAYVKGCGGLKYPSDGPGQAERGRTSRDARPYLRILGQHAVLPLPITSPRLSPRSP